MAWRTGAWAFEQDTGLEEASCSHQAGAVTRKAAQFTVSPERPKAQRGSCRIEALQKRWTSSKLLALLTAFHCLSLTSFCTVPDRASLKPLHLLNGGLTP